MSRYRVRIEGRNFLLSLGESHPTGKSGFFVNRDVSAMSFEEAETRAIGLIRNDDHIQSIILNVENDPPMLNMDSIRELGDGEETLNNSG